MMLVLSHALLYIAIVLMLSFVMSLLVVLWR